jgi:hypothetical protein
MKRDKRIELIGRRVRVYDRYLFAVPVTGKITHVAEKDGAYCVKFDTDNPGGSNVNKHDGKYFHHQQCELLKPHPSETMTIVTMVNGKEASRGKINLADHGQFIRLSFSKKMYSRDSVTDADLEECLAQRKPLDNTPQFKTPKDESTAELTDDAIFRIEKAMKDTAKYTSGSPYVAAGVNLIDTIKRLRKKNYKQADTILQLQEKLKAEANEIHDRLRCVEAYYEDEKARRVKLHNDYQDRLNEISKLEKDLESKQRCIDSYVEKFTLKCDEVSELKGQIEKFCDGCNQKECDKRCVIASNEYAENQKLIRENNSLREDVNRLECDLEIERGHAKCVHDDVCSEGYSELEDELRNRIKTLDERLKNRAYTLEQCDEIQMLKKENADICSLLEEQKAETERARMDNGNCVHQINQLKSQIDLLEKYPEEVEAITNLGNFIRNNFGLEDCQDIRHMAVYHLDRLKCELASCNKKLKAKEAVIVNLKIAIDNLKLIDGFGR